jgi:hypothetical protein
MAKADALPDALSDLSRLPATDPTGQYLIPRGPLPSQTWEGGEGGMRLIQDNTARIEEDSGEWDPIHGYRSYAQIRQSARELLEERQREQDRLLDLQTRRNGSLHPGAPKNRARLPLQPPAAPPTYPSIPEDQKEEV